MAGNDLVSEQRGVGNSDRTECRLVIDPPLPGAWNMAVDEVLLDDAVESGRPTLRLYQWSEPTLSLGYFQRYAGREQHAASRACAVVRRQSGGGAIMHDRELTYSLVLPQGHEFARNTAELYNRVHEAFINVLSALNPSATEPPLFRLRGDTAAIDQAAEPFLCFQRRSPGDVVLHSASAKDAGQLPVAGKSPATGWKILGSAQRRHRGAILQHGSLLVEVSVAAPELPGLRDLGIPVAPLDEFSDTLCHELAIRLALWLIPSELPLELQSKAAKLANIKYGSDAWTKRR